MTLRVKYTAGSECWYIVEGRGRWGRIPGVICLHDVMREVMGLD